jgi:four helix bundle protein
MPFPHERLSVYQSSLSFLVLASDLVEHLPRGRSHIADQLTRASTSIVLNIAEGAGKFSRPDKRRYYLTALGSATECAAILDVCLRLKLITERRHEEAKGILEQVGKMLTALAKSMEGKAEE